MSRGDTRDAEIAATNQQLINGSTRVVANSAAQLSGSLGVGRYRVVSDVDCFILQGASTVTANVTGCPYLPAKVIDYIFVDAAARGYVSVITNGDTGMLDIAAQ